jgi:hypothetical protein
MTAESSRPPRQDSMRPGTGIACDRGALTVIPHRPVDVAGVFGGQAVFPYATGASGNLIGWPVSGPRSPHELAVGTTGAGTSVSNRVVAIEAARQGADVRLLDPTGKELCGLRDWPNVTAVAAGAADMAGLIEDTYREMGRRFDAVERGQATFAGFRRIVLIVDAYPILRMLLAGTCAQAPALANIEVLIKMGRAVGINLRVTGHTSTAFTQCLRVGEFGSRVALGRPSRQMACTLFGDPSAGEGIPDGAIAVGTVLSPGGPVRASMHWLPDPAQWAELPDDERTLLLDMLPPAHHRPRRPLTGPAH